MKNRLHKSLVAVIVIFLFVFSIKIPAQSPDDWFEKIKTYDFDQDQKALVAIEQLVLDSSATTAKKKELAHRLAGLLDSGATYACKQFVCRQLAIIGTANEVPVLCKWLSDDQMSDMARYALSRIPDPSVDACLRKALNETSGIKQIGIINTIGMRADKEAVPKIATLLYSKNSGVTKSAAWALGKIGGEIAAKSLKKALSGAESDMSFELADAYLACANLFLEEGHRQAALRIYEEMYLMEELPQIKAAALNGLQASDHKNAFTFVVKALEDDQVQMQQMAARLVQNFPGKKQTETFSKQLLDLSPPGQVLLLNGLKERGDPAAVPDVETACNSQDQSVRCAALEALGKLGNASHISLLAARAAHGSGAEQEKARNSLSNLQGEAVEDKMIDEAQTADAKTRIELINALALLQSQNAVPMLLKACKNSNKSVRKVAFKALGRLANDNDLPALIDLIANANTEIEKEAEDAVVAISHRTKTEGKCTAIILNKFETAKKNTANKSLLKIVGAIGDDSALPYLRSTLESADEDLKAAAIRGLSAWPNSKPIYDILEVAKQSDNPTHRVLALRGYINLIGVNKDLPESEQLDLYKDAIELSEQDQEKVQVLSKLSDVFSLEAIKIIEPYLQHTPIQAEAAMAIINISRQIYAQDLPYIRVLVDWILPNVSSETVKKQAREVNNLIEKLSPYILDWQISGPYKQGGKTGPELFDIELKPEMEKGKGLIWWPALVGTNAEKPFLIDLREIVNADDFQVVYLRTNLISAQNQNVLFGIGSDDGIKVWLNGKVIHANNITRRHWQNEDWVQTSLEKGMNELMLKVTQHTGGWGVSLSIHNPDTTRIEGLGVDAWPVLTSSTDQDDLSIFDGRSFSGWEGNYNIFRIHDGAIIGGSLTKNLSHNEFLCTKREYHNFILRLKVKLVGDMTYANAGIQIRSRRIPGSTEMIGYQADMGQHYWGSLYDESRRKMVIAQANLAALRKVLKPGEWNDYIIRCEGKRVRLFINGYQTVDFIETDDSIEQTGVIGLQIHSGPASEAWYKDISLKVLEHDIPFRVNTINAESKFEAAGILDVNNDELLDIFCGSFWYEAPEWEKHFVRDQKEEHEYYNDFANLPLDVNGDGWTDIVNAAFFNKTLFWIRNPGNSGGPFQVIDIDQPGSMETAIAIDINNDGKLDVLPNDGGSPAWYEFHPEKSAENGVRWERHDLPREVRGHGNGAGDVNSDGRCDIICRQGWLEQTNDIHSLWVWHPEFDLGDRPGIPILVHDVDADGDADLIWGHGHDYGLYWLEQSQDISNNRIWKKHIIDSEWSQVHFMLLVDLNNNGQEELVTGKRFRAHNGHDPGGHDPLCVYYYNFDRTDHQWYRHTISQGEKVGFGINTQAADIDGDGDIDIVAPGKSGLYLLENLFK